MALLFETTELASQNIGPIVTSGMFLQFLEGAQIISLNSFSKQNKSLNRSIQKLAALALAIIGITITTVTYFSMD